MNSVDIGILIIFGISCLAGFMRGFTREVLGLFTWAGSAFATYIAVPLLGGITRTYIANPMIADAITAVILFILFLIIFSIISGALANSVKRSSLGSIDRSLGVSFGIVRSIIIVCAAEIILSTFTLRQNQADTIQTARFTPMIRRGSENLIQWVPQNVREFIATQQSEAMAKTTPHHNMEKSVEEVLSNAMQGVAAEAIVKQQPEALQKILQQVQGPPSQRQQHVPAQHHNAPHKKTEEDTEKTAESLAKLTPQTMDTKGKDGDYNTRQRRDLDRLVQINQ